MEKSDIKNLLADKCRKYVTERINRAQEAMHEAQEAANEEIKSSAGDKYNTDRALMHIERDNHARQLAEAQILMKSIDMIDFEKLYDHAHLGSLVETSNGNYFLSISIGKIEVAGFSAFAISTATPIGKELQGKTVGDQFTVNSKTFSILRIS